MIFALRFCFCFLRTLDFWRYLAQCEAVRPTQIREGARRRCVELRERLATVKVDEIKPWGTYQVDVFDLRPPLKLLTSDERICMLITIMFFRRNNETFSCDIRTRYLQTAAETEFLPTSSA